MFDSRKNTMPEGKAEVKAASAALVRPKLFVPTLLGLSIALAGCGGGGGGGSGATSIAPIVDKNFAVSGRIQVAANSYVDLDTADTGGGIFTARNNRITAPQAINNPAIVGGYVSARSGTYASSGNLFSYPADPTDFYRVTLVAGQQVTLKPRIADDFLGSSVVAQRLTVKKVNKDDPTMDPENINNPMVSDDPQTVQIIDSGEYLIQIDETKGPSNYTLIVGEFGALASLDNTAAVDLNVPAGARFVAGEAIVVMKGNDSGAYATASASEENGAASIAELMSSQNIVDVEALTEGSDTHKFTFDMSGGMSTASASSAPNGREAARAETLARIAELRKQPGVLLAEPNYIRHASAAPAGTNPLRRYQWHNDAVNLTPAWELTSGEGSVVAVLDTGIYSNHPDLLGQTTAGCDFVSNLNTSLDGDGVDGNPEDPGDSLIGQSSFHGTHVAGTIVAADNTVGGIGVAFSSKVMPLRVLGKNGEGSDFDIARAIRFAAGLENVPECGGTATKVDVINLSLGSPGNSVTLSNAVKAANDAGVVVVAAAGNDSTSAPFYPAAFPEVISVGAVGLDLVKAPYSNFGSTISLVAPGGNIQQDLNTDTYGDGVLSTWANDSGSSVVASYGFMQGTSMAAPHVAGVIALLQSYRKTVDALPVLTPDAVRGYIASGDFTRDLGDPQRDDVYGDGIIDATKALTVVAQAGPNPVPTPVINANVTNIQFTVSGSVDLILSVPETGVVVTNVAATTVGDQGWLTYEKIDDANYRIIANANVNGLAEGVSYPGAVKVIYTSSIVGGMPVARTLTIPVALDIPNTNIASDAGAHYVLLVEVDTGEDYQFIANVSNGFYDFAFSEIPAGNYQVYAGSDMDNDGFICDTGEACAAFPLRNLPDIIRLATDRNDIDFQTGFEDDIAAEGSSSDSLLSSILSGKGIKRLPGTPRSQDQNPLASDRQVFGG
ncbi:S8 family serine peptidase [Allohahella marinimesophila]|uniref:Peptidase S8/S53 domain-containing protein n=1 Tax=Allohahella marinimesophila TaxID=1054972 RepID=A0ABP7NH70_9GAMM